MQARVSGVILPGFWLRHFSAARPANGVFYFVKMDNHEFTGVFIPAHIWLSNELEPAEKMILGEVEALSKKTGWCTAGRAHFAKWLKCTPPNVSYYTEKLEKLGFLDVERAAGHGNKMRVNAERFYLNEPVNGVYGGSKRGLPGVVNGVYGGSKRGLPKRKDKYNYENKEEKENAQNALTPPFTPAGTIQLPETNIPLNAEKKANDFTGAGPGAEFIVTTVTPQAPYIRIVEKVEIQDAPGPKSPGEKIRELCAVNYKIREGFTMSRKIPGGKFDEYLQAFDAEQAAMPIPKKYRSDNDLVAHFLNFSGVRWSVEQRNAIQSGQQSAPKPRLEKNPYAR